MKYLAVLAFAFMSDVWCTAGAGNDAIREAKIQENYEKVKRYMGTFLASAFYKSNVFQSDNSFSREVVFNDENKTVGILVMQKNVERNDGTKTITKTFLQLGGEVLEKLVKMYEIPKTAKPIITDLDGRRYVIDIARSWRGWKGGYGPYFVVNGYTKGRAYSEQQLEPGPFIRVGYFILDRFNKFNTVPQVLGHDKFFGFIDRYGKNINKEALEKFIEPHKEYIHVNFIRIAQRDLFKFLRDNIKGIDDQAAFSELVECYDSETIKSRSIFKDYGDKGVYAGYVGPDVNALIQIGEVGVNNVEKGLRTEPLYFPLVTEKAFDLAKNPDTVYVLEKIVKDLTTLKYAYYGSNSYYKYRASVSWGEYGLCICTSCVYLPNYTDNQDKAWTRLDIELTKQSPDISLKITTEEYKDGKAIEPPKA